MESSNVSTPSMRDERNCWTSCTTSNRGNISRIVAILIGWKVVDRFFEKLLLSANCPRSPGRRENSVWTKTEWIIWRTNYSIWCSGGLPPMFQERDKGRLHQFGKKVLAGIFLGYALIAGGIWNGDILIADTQELEKLYASELFTEDWMQKKSW